MGQRKTVRVFQLIAEDTVESRVLDIRELCDTLARGTSSCLMYRENQGRYCDKGS